MWERVREVCQVRRAKDGVQRSVRKALRVRFSRGDGGEMVCRIVVVRRVRRVIRAAARGWLSCISEYSLFEGDGKGGKSKDKLMGYHYERPRDFKVVVPQLFHKIGHDSCDDEGGYELNGTEDVEGEGWVWGGF